MREWVTYFITWTTYGTWLPGDSRGWRKTNRGDQQPQPQLEAWTQKRLSGRQVLLNETDRSNVETICRKHAAVRGWMLHAVATRSNHVHLAVTADNAPDIVRDQFKAYATRAVRASTGASHDEKIWTRGGDVRIVDGEDNLERVVQYISEAQDRMGLDR